MFVFNDDSNKILQLILVFGIVLSLFDLSRLNFDGNLMVKTRALNFFFLKFGFFFFQNKWCILSDCTPKSIAIRPCSFSLNLTI